MAPPEEARPVRLVASYLRLREFEAIGIMPGDRPLQPSDISRLIEEHKSGNPDAIDAIVPLLYDELRRIAAYYLRSERPDHTLQPTALVNEAYLRLVGREELQWESRAHLIAIAARVMRHVLVDHARSRRTDKRAGVLAMAELDDALDVLDERGTDLVALDDALGTLETLDVRQSRVVEMRFFGGLSVEETAEVLGVSTVTIKRDWSTAKLWLKREMTRR
jgi:RNA polymerase sigma factor (TIGR02999 family)